MNVDFSKPFKYLILVIFIGFIIAGGLYAAGDKFGFVAKANANRVEAETEIYLDRLTDENAYLKAVHDQDVARYTETTKAIVKLMGTGVWMGYAIQLAVTFSIVLLMVSGTFSLSTNWGSKAYLAVQRARLSAIVTDLGGGLKEIKNTEKGMVISTQTGRTHISDESVPADEYQAQIEQVRLLSEHMGRVARENNAVDLFIHLLDRLPALTRKQVAPGFYREVGRQVEIDTDIEKPSN